MVSYLMELPFVCSGTKPLWNHDVTPRMIRRKAKSRLRKIRRLGKKFNPEMLRRPESPPPQQAGVSAPTIAIQVDTLIDAQSRA